MSQQRVALVTGGMGGLGEVISTKMADAGYKVAVTYSPGNTKHAEWVADMKGPLEPGEPERAVHAIRPRRGHAEDEERRQQREQHFL